MYIVDEKLNQREKEGNFIRVGIIGSGEMGKGLINQICRYTPGMTVVAVYNRTIEKAQKAMVLAGVDNAVVVNSLEDFEMTIDQGKTALTNQIDVLLEGNPIDVLVELTGTIEFGLQALLKAFIHGKHVVSFNAELEATFGTLLKTEAEKNNVRYTLGDGDQPGVTINLFRKVKLMGFEPLLCGNIKGLQDHYRNPTTQQGFAKQWGMTPEMVTSFADGTKISFEQACIANATGMSIAQHGMIGPHYTGHVDEMTKGFYPDVDKLKELGGIVDYVVGAKPGPGVFVFATTNDPVSTHCLHYGKLGEGPLYSFYVPYHLLFFELTFSIARLIDFNDVTLTVKDRMGVEVVAVAKKDLKSGETIDCIGGYTTYGACENSSIVKQEKIVPMGLAEKMVVKKDVKKDQIITFDLVDYTNKIELVDKYRAQK